MENIYDDNRWHSRKLIALNAQDSTNHWLFFFLVVYNVSFPFVSLRKKNILPVFHSSNSPQHIFLAFFFFNLPFYHYLQQLFTIDHTFGTAKESGNMEKATPIRSPSLKISVDIWNRMTWTIRLGVVDLPKTFVLPFSIQYLPSKGNKDLHRTF